jgi:hypothetical protein
MKTQNRSRLAHKNHPLFAAAKDIYRSLHAIKRQRSAAAKASQLDRVGTQLLIYVAEAIDLPWLRWRRLEGAQGYLTRLDAVLEALLIDAAIEPVVFERVSDELDAFSDALEAFACSMFEPAGAAEPEPEPELATTRTPETPAEAREPATVPNSPGSPPESNGSSPSTASHEQGSNGSPGTARPPGRHLGGT